MSDRPHRPWALYALVPLLLGGIGVSVYMTRHHETQLYGGAAYQGEALVGCAEAEGVSCDIVNTSAWSELLGVPLFTWAIPFYLAAIVLALRGARGVHGAKAVLAAFGLGASVFSAVLYGVSVIELGYVCLWCMRLYALNALLLVLPLVSGLTRRDLPSARELGLTAALLVGFTVVAVGAQRFYRAGLLEEGGGIELAGGGAPTDDPLGKDPTAPAPTRSIDVKTEDGNDAKLQIHPGDAWKGNPAARVAIVEFGDFECGYCKRAGYELKRVYERYKDEIVLVFKHFPLDPACNPGVKNKKHARACEAAAASSCAQEQGSFWAMHDLLYKNNHQLLPEHLLAYANKLGLDEAAFTACMKSQRGQADVAADAAEGAALDIHGTPRIWINGQLYRAGQSAEQMAAAIERELGRTATQASLDALGGGAALPTMVPATTPSMRPITFGDLSFRIDSFEASVVDGKAVSTLHTVPAIRSSWYTADAACKAAGKRMCTEEEWIAACQSARPVDDDGNGQFADDLIEGNAYPYGDLHEPGRCWEGHVAGKTEPGTAPAWRPVYTGEMPACVTPGGVYDLTGNVEEWVGATPETAVLLGGAFDTPDDKARCYRRNDTFGPGYANLRTGFRCCQ